MHLFVQEVAYHGIDITSNVYENASTKFTHTLVHLLKLLDIH